MYIFNENKRYNSLSNYYKNKYKKKVFKVSLNGNFTCPNLDGKLSKKGCIYCSELGSGDFAGNKVKSIQEQYLEVKERMLAKWPDAYYIPYLQANTNTYGTVEKIKSTVDDIIDIKDDFVMISISTRCDCLDDDILSYLGELNKKIPVQIELGLQSSKQESLDFINRCHTVECVTAAVNKLRSLGIEVVLHIINGLPNETKEDMINTAKYCNSLDIQGVKIHMLHVMEKTMLGRIYKEDKFHILTLEEYTDITVEQIRLLRKEVVIHRLTGDAPKDLLIEPRWTLKKFVVLNEIDKIMGTNDYWQGDKLDD